MTAEEDYDKTWLEALRDLIRRKQAENIALEKIRESLVPGTTVRDTSSRPADDDPERSCQEENQKGEKENNQ
jgi:hypothetical protein